MRFKVGDVVTCTEKDRYCIADYGVKCIVKRVYLDGDIAVVVKDGPSLLHDVFGGYFKKTKPNNLDLK